MLVRGITSFAAALFVAAGAGAQGAPPSQKAPPKAPAKTAPAPAQAKEVKLGVAKPAYTSRAKITFDAAKATAEAKVPGAHLTKAELEEEKGKLIYSLVYKTDGKKGFDEVNVDAVTGQVVDVEHENAPAPKAKAPVKKGTK